MSLKSGTQSIRRYRVEGSLADNFPDNVEERIEKFTFREIEEGSPKELSFGWVSMENPFIGALTQENYYKNGYVVMSMRIDKKTIPSRTLKSFILKEEHKRLKGLNKERLSSKEKKDIKEAITVKLLQKALPASSNYDFLWNLNTSTVLFFASGDNINNTFIELFEETFQMQLIKMSPFSMALARGIEQQSIVALKETIFS
jgi:recombination associated protein RdgC